MGKQDETVEVPVVNWNCSLSIFDENNHYDTFSFGYVTSSRNLLDSIKESVRVIEEKFSSSFTDGSKEAYVDIKEV